MTEIKIGRSAANRITVSFPYNPDYIAKIKTMQGYRWHPEEKCWSLPSGNDILDRLASLFEGERLGIDPFLKNIVDKANPTRDFPKLPLATSFIRKTLYAIRKPTFKKGDCNYMWLIL
ncbi:MAG: hypothetical protein Q8M95_04220 [Candidatus Methanoperedens sp.]|nr:hypothetical protein [Candidatus Methanoperedens sp.]